MSSYLPEGKFTIVDPPEALFTSAAAIGCGGDTRWQKSGDDVTGDLTEVDDDDDEDDLAVVVAVGAASAVASAVAVDGRGLMLGSL